MRIFSILLILILQTACSSAKVASLSKIQAADCPEEGVCSIEILKNKSLLIKEDTIGQLYYNLDENNAKTVYVYTYFVAGPENTQDGNLTEKIIFELDNNATEINFKNEDLQKVNMLFSRACFCKGQMGLFKITNGTLQFDAKQKTLFVEAITSKVSQTLTKFSLH